MQTYHFCWSSHNELLCRDDEDYIRAFNCLALAALETDSTILADGIMSDHMHVGVRTNVGRKFFSRARFAYSRFFNAKYHRAGRLGERTFFMDEMLGNNHTCAGLSYILRQALHHGLCDSPFEYPHCSIRVAFSNLIGYPQKTDSIMSIHEYRKMMPGRKSLPSGYHIEKSGLILRNDVIDASYIEGLFVTHKNYLMHMTRRSDESWIIEQKKDNNNTTPITLETIERHTPDVNIQTLLRNEQKYHNRKKFTDQQLCRLIDEQYLSRQHAESKVPARSIYDLTPSQRSAIGNSIYSKSTKTTKQYMDADGQIKTVEYVVYNGMSYTIQQLRRCLAL